MRSLPHELESTNFCRAGRLPGARGRRRHGALVARRLLFGSRAARRSWQASNQEGGDRDNRLTIDDELNGTTAIPTFRGKEPQQ
jgi:hypothetical protein